MNRYLSKTYVCQGRDNRHPDLSAARLPEAPCPSTSFFYPPFLLVSIPHVLSETAHVAKSITSGGATEETSLLFYQALAFPRLNLPSVTRH